MKRKLLLRVRLAWLLAMLCSYTHALPLQDLAIARDFTERHPETDDKDKTQRKESQTLKTVLEKLQSEYKVYFTYDLNLVENQKVQVEDNSNRGSVEEVLENYLSPLNLQYRKTGENYYVIYRQRKLEIEKVQSTDPQRSESQNIDPRSKGTHKQLWLSSTEATLLQMEVMEKNISGKVTDSEDGSGLPGVNILAKGTSIGTITDVDGNYNLSVPDETTTLVFSSVGYETEEVEINGRTTINMALMPDIQSLSEVVVVGYGTQKKVTATGSVNTVKGEVIKQSPATNLTNNLVGRLPGVTALSTSGEPGYDNSIIRIRGSNTLGNNSPLIVIDGIANRSGGLGRLNPNDIETITVLKDASAAIYGAQAANGVILVTTKRGTTGKPTINFNYNQGFNQPARLPEMADAATYATMLNEIDNYRGRNPRFTEEEIQKFSDGSDPWNYPNTDWFDAALKPVSLQSMANLSLNGGSERIKYFLSLGYTGEDGFYENSATRYDQVQFRSNVDGKISDHINLGFDVLGRQETRNFPTRDAGGIFRSLMRGKPTLPAYWPNGLPGPDIESGDNPVVTGTDATGYDKDKQYFLQTNIRLNVTVPGVEGLSFTANAAFDKDSRFRKLWRTPWYLYTWDYTSYDDNGDPALVRSKRGLDEPQLQQWAEDGLRTTFNAYVNYEKAFGDHAFTIMAGTERQTYQQDRFDAFRRFFISESVDQLQAGGQELLNNYGTAEQSARLNYFGRVNYNFMEKYLAEFVWRYDGSYIFPEDKRFGFFPGISLGWRISEENFWKNSITFMDNFKIRGSWGQTGNDRIDEYQFLSTYGFGQGYVFDVDDNVQTIYPTRVPNPNVTWEVANQFNVGMEGQLFGGKLSFEVDYFNNLRTDILWWRNASVPATAGISLPRENIGEVVNRGVDGLITYSQTYEDFRFDISINGSYARNEIKFWDEAPGVPEYQQSTGQPMFTNLYYNAIGVFEDEEAVNSYPHWDGARPGDIIFEDVNDDGVIDGLDRVRVDKNIIPRFTGGFAFNAGYKNIDLAILFQGATGHVQYLYTNEAGEIGNYMQEFAENRWTPENPTANYPRTFNRQDEYWINQANTFWLRDADYIRLKNVEIGYNFPSTFNERFGIQGLRIYVNGFNLLTFDKLKVLDPEGSPNEDDLNDYTQNGYYYPQKRVLNAGLSVTF